MLPEVTALIDDVTYRPRHVTRKSLGIGLGLTLAVRMDPAVRAKDIWPIGWTHRDWKEDRARKARERTARNRAKKPKADRRPITMKARAIRFVEETILANGPMPVAEVMRLAVGMGLQPKRATKPSKPLREACMALGIVQRRNGWQGAVIWALPEPAKSLISSKVPTFNSQPPLNQTDHPKNPDISIGALLRSQTTDEATTSANHQRPTTGTDLTDCEVAFTGSGSLEAPPSTTGTNPVSAKEVELVALGTATEPGEPCTGSMNRNGVTGIYEPEEQRMFDVGYIDPGEDYWRLRVFGSDLPPTREEVRAEIIAKAKEIAAAPIPDDIEPWEPWERDDGCDHDAPPLTISVEPHASKRRQPTLKQSLKMEIKMRQLRRHLSNQGHLQDEITPVRKGATSE